jgi:hypothetical protein
MTFRNENPNLGLGKQVGGNHYQGGIQPFQLSHANGHDGCTHAIQKYLTRYRKKAGIEDLKKAHQICYIRVDTISIYGKWIPPEKPMIQMGDYLRSNSIDPITARAIVAMESWFRKVDTDDLREADLVRSLIRQCAENFYNSDYLREDFI